MAQSSFVLMEEDNCTLRSLKRMKNVPLRILLHFVNTNHGTLSPIYVSVVITAPDRNIIVEG